MPHILPLLFVALGGACGAAARHYAGQGVHMLLPTGFPWGTLLINVFGSFVMGGVLAYFLINEPHHYTRLLFATGFLGAFTTFSTFSLDALQLWLRGESAAAFIYVAASVILSLLCVFMGMVLAQRIWT